LAVSSLYLVAWPDSTLNQLESVPLNATCLITDWQARFEPEILLRGFLRELLRSADWRITDRVVEVESVDRELLVRCANDEEVATAFEESTGLLRQPRLEEFQPAETAYGASALRLLVQPDAHDFSTRVSTDGIPVLLGAAIISVMNPGITYHAQEAYIADRRRAVARRGEP
jgi:hypothetical protein